MLHQLQLKIYDVLVDVEVEKTQERRFAIALMVLIVANGLRQMRRRSGDKRQSSSRPEKSARAIISRIFEKCELVWLGTNLQQANPDFKELLLAFNAHGVEYLKVGARTLAAHGHLRRTKDLAVFGYERTALNT